MTWPTEIYVATRYLGVYYTSNFVHPDTQPVWAAVNTGLANVGCREFKLDPFNPADKQYVLTESDRILYRRDNQGSWASILTPAQVDTLLSTSGCTIGSFCVDHATSGRLWALVGSPSTGTTPYGYWAIYSDNYGTTWTAVTKIVHTGNTYAMGQIRASGNNVFASCAGSIAAAGQVYYSYNKGSTWASWRYSYGEWDPKIRHTPLAPARIYFNGNLDKTLRYIDAGSETATGIIVDNDSDRMWFDGVDINHQRAIVGSALRVTYDHWATFSDITPTDWDILGISYYSGGGEQMLVALDISFGKWHVIGAMTGEVTTVTGIAGSSPGTSPYTNSIPNTCGGACLDGVQGVWHVPSQNIYSYDVLFESEPAGSGVYPYGVDFGEDGIGVSVQSVEME